MIWYNLRTQEPHFYKNCTKNSRGDDTKTYKIFAVPLGNEKTTRKIKFHPEVPVIKYHHNSSNSFFKVV